ncbi:hypothetical protein C1I98_15145 [Spongiactinospora gelatinilytica]|uniref:Uncharacterized protein n=1 Tax=Spongiactinospora gelatinilytica TaxID=2666298 RepID=A0A2W2G7V4_9ACTN|nr:ParA family protein [Spongiactinospora gelatinilytica]PZG45886.1 hypothetical protein C1I98_15145 [Spongiactinospora gelatinilytica]
MALALTWPREVLLAECDPAGGSLLSGYLAGQPQDRGLGEWAVRLRRGGDSAAALAEQVVHLTGGQRILPGLAEPAQLSLVQPLWPAIGEALAALPGDVIADIGRIGGTDTPTPLLTAADQVLVVARPSLRDLSALAPRLKTLPRARVLLAGAGPYSRREVAKTLAVEVVDHLPHDVRAATLLSHGTGNTRYLARSLLLRAARSLANTLAERALPKVARS